MQRKLKLEIKRRHADSAQGLKQCCFRREDPLKEHLNLGWDLPQAWSRWARPLDRGPWIAGCECHCSIGSEARRSEMARPPYPT
ncbi:unnamed protein product [Pieris macdunnoughi]|uniref:Uncharacterized protein n=1 Tax=Pieris macdunnoughi TaxID=345717 RepID=A0A821X8W4_9NEOP|nr:unnamed protein product [Pieris macdunnoughi]